MLFNALWGIADDKERTTDRTHFHLFGCQLIGSTLL
jgi:hypothetical protein